MIVNETQIVNVLFHLTFDEEQKKSVVVYSTGVTSG